MLRPLCYILLQQNSRIATKASLQLLWIPRSLFFSEIGRVSMIPYYWLGFTAIRSLLFPKDPILESLRNHYSKEASGFLGIPRVSQKRTVHGEGRPSGVLVKEALLVPGHSNEGLTRKDPSSVPYQSLLECLGIPLIPFLESRGSLFVPFWNPE